MSGILDQATLLYVAAVIGGFTLVAVWETVHPLRPASVPLGPRWTANISLYFLSHGLTHLLFPVVAVGAALLAQHRGWGILNNLPVNTMAALLFSVLMLDLARYLLHLAFHRIPLLWRLHRAHHSDLDYDCTIGLRFHPLEALLVNAVLTTLIIVGGLPAMAVLLADLLTITLGFVVHGNVSLPTRLDRALRVALVTPDMHRIHHSIRADEAMSNYGSVLSVWDRFVGTYRASPRDGALGMQFGLANLRDSRDLSFFKVLLMPFHKPSPTASGESAPQ